LRERNHLVLGAILIALALVCVALAAALALASRGFGRIGSVGVALLLGALPCLLLGLLVRASAETSDFNADVERQLADIAGGLAWIAVRNGAAFAALGALMLALAFVLGRLFDAAPARSFADHNHGGG
jgi:hypothetical protein